MSLLAASVANADTLGHNLPDASSMPPITLHHARQAVLPREPAAQEQSGRDICVCITCHTPCRNDAALRKHGEKEHHHPYGCVCGNIFSRPDVLQRHIASKNKVTRFACRICEHDETLKAFARADHLSQHLRTFHKIPAGIIPEYFGANPSQHDHSEDVMHPHLLPEFPCLIPGCPRTGDLAYLRQVDLDEHMAYMHYAPQNNMPIQQEPSNYVSTYTNHSFQQSAQLQASPSLWQDAPLNFVGNLEAEGGFWGGGWSGRNMYLQPHEELKPNFE
ncbi:hypothetical protein F5Y09DRAFT_134029 [Xylaria sp. FL1042]|nr:hypothetical protein F5Y09DRAFT_134029 [Xylaria sp. FL1042]